MKTEELIRALAADGRPVRPIGSSLLRALPVGAVASLAIFVLLVRPRPDLEQALLTLPFVFKLAVAAAVAAGALLFLPEASRPVSSYHRRWLMLLAPLLLVVGVGAELATQPPHTWAARLVGRNALHCLSLIPMLSLPVLVCLFSVLRRGAPSRPGIAGAAAGLAAGGIGALLYAVSCPDDSSLYVATWYSIAIGFVAFGSAQAGSRLLRW
jgi:hypothetical protein